MSCSAIVLSRFVFETRLFQAVELWVCWSVSSPKQLSVVDKTKEFGYCLCWEAGISVFCQFFSKICRLIHMQWLCHQLWSSHLLATHKCIERFLHSIWRYRSKSSMVHGESALLSVPGAFSLFQDADSVRHKDWVLLGQLLRLHSGQLLAPIDKICLRTPGQDSFGLRGLEKRECKADKGLQGRNFFSKKKENNFSSKKSNMVIYF